MLDNSVILLATVGSQAYGLATPESDTDRLGVFVAPSDAFWGLRFPRQTYVTNDPDVTMHEVGKMVALLLKCNPTVTELLWLEGPNAYETRTVDGYALTQLRSDFLSAPYVRNAYFGYAEQQFRKLTERGDGSFSSALRNRTEKHGRHMLRLLQQGYELYSTGTLSISLDDPERYRAFGRAVDADATVGVDALADYRRKFDGALTPLPESPNTEKVEAWLVDLRRRTLASVLHGVYSGTDSYNVRAR